MLFLELIAHLNAMKLDTEKKTTRSHACLQCCWWFRLVDERLLMMGKIVDCLISPSKFIDWKFKSDVFQLAVE